MLLAALLVAACAPTEKPAVPAALAPFAGKHVAVTLGFTRCPDVCPTELWHWRQALRSLTPQERAGLRLAFVTVDPQRDTPDALERYLAHFDPAFAGVRVTGDELKELLRFLHAHARKVPSRPPGEYTVDHTAGSVLLDPSGRRIDEFRHGTASTDIAARLRSVLTGKSADRPATPSRSASATRSRAASSAGTSARCTSSRCSHAAEAASATAGQPTTRPTAPRRARPAAEARTISSRACSSTRAS